MSNDLKFEEFQEVLIGITSEEQNQESSAIIENLIEEKYPLYIELLMNAIQQVDNRNIFNISTTLLKVEIRTGRIFHDPDLAMEIIENLTPLIANILQSPNVQDNFKVIMAYILAQLHIFVYHNTNNVAIPTYILTAFNQMPEIRRYLIDCIVEISINDPDFGGFDLEDIIAILSDNSEDDSIYIPKVNLFFAVATRQPDIQILQEIFPDLFLACPKKDLNELLISISDFAEHSSIFFLPYLGQLVQRLCEIAGDTEVEPLIRDNSMICLSAIAEGAPEMCQSIEEYYDPVFKTLLEVSAEIDDDSPWEYDANNYDPYQTALDQIGVLFEKFDNPNIFVPIIELVMSVLSADEVPWQTVYAAISALADINMIAMSSIDEEIQKNLFERVALFIDIECHPRVRVAIYNFISKLSLHNVLYPQYETSVILIEPLESLLITEDIPVAKKLAYEAYTQFISQPTSQKNSQYFESFFPEVVKELQEEPEEFTIYIVRLLGPLVKSARDDANKHFPAIFNIAAALLKNNDPNIQAEAIQCFSLAITYVPKTERIIRFCSQFVLYGINLLQSNQLDDESLDHLYDAIHNLFKAMGRRIAPIVPHILPKIIEDSQKAITIEESNAFEPNESLKNKSLYLRISPPDSPVKQYAAVNEVTDVRHALLILEALIISDPNFKDYLTEVYQIIDNWLTNEFQIEKIQNKCWSILNALLTIFEYHFNDIDSELDVSQQSQLEELVANSTKNIEIIFQCYISNIERRGNPLFISTMLKITNNAIKFANNLKWFDEELFTSILQTLQPLINDLFSMKEKKFKYMEEFDLIDLDDKFISHCDTCLSEISELISSCFVLQPDITNEFYSQTIEPRTEEYLSNDLNLVFGITTTCSFIIYTKDMAKMQEFIEMLMKYSFSFDREDDVPAIALYSLGKLFLNIELQSQEDAEYYMNFFNKFLKTDQVSNDTDKMNNISDYANVAFAKFLHINNQYFDPEFIVESFIDASPLWETPEDSDDYYLFMDEMLRNGWLQQTYEEEWPEYSLGQILTGYLDHRYEEKTRRSFAETLSALYNTPEGKAAMDKTLQESIHPNRAMFFWDLINTDNNDN